MNHKKHPVSRRAVALSLVATLCAAPVSCAQHAPSLAAGKKAAKTAAPKLNKTKLSVCKGEKKTVKITNAKKIKIKKVKWTANKSSVIRLSKKTKKSVCIHAKKKGTTVLTAKITTTAKTYTKKVSVTVKKKPSPATPKPDGSISPDQTAVPQTSGTPADTPTKRPLSTLEPTMTPAIYGKAGEVAFYDKEKANYQLSVDADHQVHEISDMLYGIFFEDINFAADGGLYAEMVKNRSFEFTRLAAGNEKHAWSDVGTVSAEVVTTDKEGCLNVNNPNYMVLKNTSGSPAGIANPGFLDGMSVTKDAGYNFSIYARGLDGYTGALQIRIVCEGDTLAEGTVSAVTADWARYELRLTASDTASKNVMLQVLIPDGSVAVDMVSLFPEDTYKGRENGLRKDLAEKLEDLTPAFLRFPGGCVVEGVRLEHAYNWKDSIGVGPDGEPLEFNGTYGDVAARKMGQNIWTDEQATNDAHPAFMTYGLGFYEYFLLAEDLGAVGVPVVNCGLNCLIQGNGTGPEVGTEEFQQYVQDALDLVEFCRGDKNTKWGAVRIAMGHEEPFALKYIGIGNEQYEDAWRKGFYARYEAFVDAFEQAKKERPEMYGDIELMFTAGADDGDSGTHYMNAYQEASSWLKKHPDMTIQDFAGAIDHHYYNDPDWFFQHTDYYDEDNYSRTTDTMLSTRFGGGIPVFLGEYAARSNTWNAALAEAAYMTGLERNGDIVKMAAYAPLFGNLTAMHWAPDLIWFNNHTSTASVNYYVQKIFANNAGTALLDSSLEGALIPPSALRGRVGIGTWNTSASFDNVKIVDNDTGKTIEEDDFSTDDFSYRWDKVSDGNWSVKDGKLVQSSTSTNTNAFATTGTAAYFGDTLMKNYTYTVDATKTGGQEGFLVPFAVGDKNNNYFWNIGGWNNTVSCLQQVSNGTKSDAISGTSKNCVLKTGETYHLKVVVTDQNVKCYINGQLYVDYTPAPGSIAECYHVVSTDKSGDTIIKMVNVTDCPKTVAIDIKTQRGIAEKGVVDVAAGDRLAADNILGHKEDVTMTSSELGGLSSQFNYTVPKYSVSVIRMKHN